MCWCMFSSKETSRIQRNFHEFFLRYLSAKPAFPSESSPPATAAPVGRSHHCPLLLRRRGDTQTKRWHQEKRNWKKAKWRGVPPGWRGDITAFLVREGRAVLSRGKETQRRRWRRRTQRARRAMSSGVQWSRQDGDTVGQDVLLRPGERRLQAAPYILQLCVPSLAALPAFGSSSVCFCPHIRKKCER